MCALFSRTVCLLAFGLTLFINLDMAIARPEFPPNCFDVPIIGSTSNSAVAISKFGSIVRYIPLKIETEFSNKYPRGQIIRQFPQAGCDFSIPKLVTIYVSKGPKPPPFYCVTQVLNANQRQVSITVNRNHAYYANVRVEYQASSNTRKGKIIRQHPLSGACSNVPPQTVTAFVSKGQDKPLCWYVEKVTRPRQRTARVWNNRRQDGRVPVRWNYEQSAGVRQGSIIRQDPVTDTCLPRRPADIAVFAVKAPPPRRPPPASSTPPPPPPTNFWTDAVVFYAENKRAFVAAIATLLLLLLVLAVRRIRGDSHVEDPRKLRVRIQVHKDKGTQHLYDRSANFTDLALEFRFSRDLGRQVYSKMPSRG